MRIRFIAALLGTMFVIAPQALAGTVTGAPEGNAAAAVVIKINGLEYKSCVYDGTAIIYTSNGPGCSVDGVDDGDVVRVESFPDPAVSIEYLSCPTAPFGPRGNFCEFTAGPVGPYQAPLPQTVRVRFTVAPKITVQKAGTGQGTVSGGAGAIDCGTTCSASLAPGTVVVLTATPAPGSAFAGWTGCASVDVQGRCTVILSTNATVTATFTSAVTLTVALEGSGQVTSAPPGITCGSGQASCAASVAPGTIVTLTASAAPGFAFAGWTGGDCGEGETCAVTVSASATVTATFVATAVQATVTGLRTTTAGATRITRLTVSADEPVDVQIVITRRGVVLVARTVRGVDGKRTVRVTIPRKVAGGKATLTVTLTNDAGATKTIERGIRIPPRG